MFTISSHERIQKVDYGVLISDAAGILRGFHEKPSTSYEVSMGVYMANHDILKYLPEGAYGFDNLMLDLISDKCDVKVESYSGYWLDIGRPDDYMKAIEEFEGSRGKFLVD